MLDAIKQLLDSNVINEDTSSAIMEAWESRLTEAKEEVRAELREEFAQRHKHDKEVMVEAIDKMVTEGLSSEIAEFNDEKKALAEDRVKFNQSMQESGARFNNFMTAKLAEEIKELRKDRQRQTEGLNAVESFVAKQLAKEVREFAQDKKDVVETKVKLVAEARDQLAELKQRFVTESAAKVRNHVKTKLTGELSALQEDIKTARENSFGRRIFEAYISEFQATHLNESAELRKMKDALEAKEVELKESIDKATKAEALTESKNREIRMIKESTQRDEVLTDLLAPLNKEKREVMSNLLESVQTVRLQNAFEKYLPAVLANKANDATPSRKTAKRVVNESRKAVTGDKTVKAKPVDDNILDITTLAGIKKV